MGFLATTKAPPLTNERLSIALEHQCMPIRSLAKIVEEAKVTKKIPNKQDIPDKELINQILSQVAGLEGESRHAAYHMVWYIKELALGRHPDA